MSAQQAHPDTAFSTTRFTLLLRLSISLRISNELRASHPRLQLPHRRQPKCSRCRGVVIPVSRRGVRRSGVPHITDADPLHSTEAGMFRERRSQSHRCSGRQSQLASDAIAADSAPILKSRDVQLRRRLARIVVSCSTSLHDASLTMHVLAHILSAVRCLGSSRS